MVNFLVTKGKVSRCLPPECQEEEEEEEEEKGEEEVEEEEEEEERKQGGASQGACVQTSRFRGKYTPSTSHSRCCPPGPSKRRKSGHQMFHVEI